MQDGPKTRQWHTYGIRAVKRSGEYFRYMKRIDRWGVQAVIIAERKIMVIVFIVMAGVGIMHGEEIDHTEGRVYRFVLFIMLDQRGQGKDFVQLRIRQEIDGR
jgi:hypothetical protein